MNKKLAKKINKMADIDQEMRQEVERGGNWDKEVDKNNTQEMKKIIQHYGWPTINLVGRKASNNAWLLVQHADHDLDFQEHALETLNKIIKEKPESIKKENVAYLTDRVLVARGEKQEFGTQFYINDNDILEPKPIRDFKNVNKRRAKYNLDPIEQYLEDAKKYIPPKNK